MARSEIFRDLLTEAVRRISVCERNKPIRVVQDELGYALDKRGGSAIEYWRQGYLPKVQDVEQLAREIIRRSDLTALWLEQFLESAQFPYPEKLCRELFPDTSLPSASPLTELLLSSSLTPPRFSSRSLIGRQALVDELISVLREPNSHWLVGIDGIGGIGKTALALEIVNQCQQHAWFDAVVWLSLRAINDAPGDAESLLPATAAGAPLFAAILQAVARQIGVENIGYLSTVEQAQWISVSLQQRRLLLVLDDLHTVAGLQEELLRNLHTLLNPSKALVLSRRRFLQDVYAVRLVGLDAAAARAFVQQEAMARRVERVRFAQSHELDAIIKETGGSPLALKLVVGQLHHLPVHVVLRHLQQGQPASGALDEDQYVQLYRQIYVPLIAQLSAAAQQLLTTLAAFVPGRGASTDTLIAISECSDIQLFAALDELWCYSLIEVNDLAPSGLTDVVYYLHPLTYYFVTAQLVPHSMALSSYWEGVLQRLLVFLLRTINTLSVLPLPLRLEVIHVLQASLPNAALWPSTRTVLLTVAPQMEQAGHRHDWLPLLQAGIAQGRTLNDQPACALFHLHLGILQQLLGQYEAAAASYGEAATGFRQSGDTYNLAVTLIRQAQLSRLRRHYTVATRLVDEAFQILSEDEVERARGYTVQGEIALDEEQWQTAVTCFTNALHLWQQTADRRMIGWNQTNLGVALRAVGHEQAALDSYIAALATVGYEQDPVHWAATHMNLGNLFLTRHDPHEALRLYEMAQPIFEKTQDLLRLALIDSNRGIAYRQLMQWQQAEAAYRSSIERYRRIGHTELEVNALDGLGLSYLGQRDYLTALRIFREAETLLQQLDGEPGWAYLHQEVQRHLQEASAYDVVTTGSPGPPENRS